MFSFRRVIVAAVIAAGPLFPTASFGQTAEAVFTSFTRINNSLASRDSAFRIATVDYLTRTHEIGRTVLFSDVGSKGVGARFVPGDLRRIVWSGPLTSEGDDITWTSDTSAQGAAPGIGLGPTQAAITRAMDTWEGVACSKMPLAGNPFTVPLNLGVAEFEATGGRAGLPFPFTDVTHAGFGTAMDALLPPPIIAATLTYVFVPVTDIDHDGRVDVAFTETYYTNNYAYGVDTDSDIDHETVALHESGHGIGQAHFGKLFQTPSNGKFHFAPRAVMNAGYTGLQQQLAGSDLAGHCGIWASWPHR